MVVVKGTMSIGASVGQIGVGGDSLEAGGSAWVVGQQHRKLVVRRKCEAGAKVYSISAKQLDH